MPISSNYWVHIAGISLCLVILGCASNRATRNEVFTQTTLQSLRVGMSANDVQSLFGRPDAIRYQQFGKDVGKPWDGIVYLYYGEREPNYKYAAKYLTNTFVFFKKVDPPKLNHWKIEFQRE